MSDSEQRTKIDVTKAAELSGMSVSWWRQRILKREVTFFKVGRRVVLDRRDIERLMESCRMAPKSE